MNTKIVDIFFDNRNYRAIVDEIKHNGTTISIYTDTKQCELISSIFNIYDAINIRIISSEFNNCEILMITKDKTNMIFGYDR